MFSRFYVLFFIVKLNTAIQQRSLKQGQWMLEINTATVSGFIIMCEVIVSNYLCLYKKISIYFT